MNHEVVPHWEWRAFAPAFDEVNRLMPAEYVMVREIYIVSAFSTASVRIGDDTLRVKTLESLRHGLELWRPSPSKGFPLCQREVREVCDHLGTPHPHALYYPEYSSQDFLVDIACGADGVRVIGVNQARRGASIDDCIVNRASVSVAGRTFQTASIESVDPEAVLRVIRRLRLDRFENVNEVAFLKRLLGIPAPEREHDPYAGRPRQLLSHVIL